MKTDENHLEWAKFIAFIIKLIVVRSFKLLVYTFELFCCKARIIARNNEKTRKIASTFVLDPLLFAQIATVHATVSVVK